VQSDADKSSKDTYKDRINPAKKALDKESEQTHCKILVPIVPIHMIEAWMLADKALLKEEIGTDKSDNELEINRKPETISDPKKVIENAIRIAQNVSKRRKSLSILELYEPLGTKIKVEKLAELSSYQDFKKNIEDAFKMLKLL
jgi:hypothetical protein